jgi:formiminotetrahydrofolate cyclodeaminase
MVEDQSAFEALTATKKQGDPAGLDAAVLAAIRVPQSIAATAAAILEQCDRVHAVANKWLLSDLAVAAELAMATVRCGSYNVRVNLADVKDDAERRKLAGWCDDLVNRSVAVVRRAIPAIWKRLS